VDSVAGFEYELCKYIEKRSGLTVQISSEHNFDLSAKGLKNRTYDVIAKNIPITNENKDDFFQYDHTHILFKNGYASKQNFVRCDALVIDVDNKGIDDPAQWTTEVEVSEYLLNQGITHTIASSRNHLKQKGNESSKPRFHVYLPLTTPCNFEQYRVMTKWLIEHFHSDPAVKSPAQFFYGNAGNPNNKVFQIDGKQCFDQFFQTIQFQAEAQKQNCTPISTSSLGVHPADAFNENGRAFIKQFLQNHGWRYMRQDSDNEYWQRPGKESNSKDHSATLKLDTRQGETGKCC
jgi:hypothetical protein